MDKSTKVFIITYSYKGNKSAQIGMHMLKNILENDDIIVNIDTSLCFLDKLQSTKAVESLKAMLEEIGIKYDYRVIQGQGQSSALGALGKILGFGRRMEDREIVTFELPKAFPDANVLSSILELGGEIFVPIEYNSDIAQQVFNCHFNDMDKRFATFKLVAYINDYLGQAAIRTRTLNLEDIKRITRF